MAEDSEDDMAEVGLAEAGAEMGSVEQLAQGYLKVVA